MNLTVLVERIDDNKYRAVTSQPVALETEGTSREEAIERLRELARERLSAAEIVELEIPDVPGSNPWTSFAGVWKDHPDFEEFLENIAEYRRKVDKRSFR
jgi:hypothetical protein